MFGIKKSNANAYAEMGIETGVAAASPIKLTIMLYDGAISACIKAVNAMQQEDYATKGEMISKAVAIIEAGLRASLDTKNGSDIAQNLDALYEYMSRSLMHASARIQIEKVIEIQGLLMDLKTAWVSIENQAVAASAQAALTQMVEQKAKFIQHRYQEAYGNSALMGA